MANFITGSRIILSIILFFIAPLSPAFYALYVTAGLTDMLDGAANYYLQSFVDSDYVPNHGLHGYSREELQVFADLLSPRIRHVGIRGID